MEDLVPQLRLLVELYLVSKPFFKPCIYKSLNNVAGDDLHPVVVIISQNVSKDQIGHLFVGIEHIESF